MAAKYKEGQFVKLHNISYLIMEIEFTVEHGEPGYMVPHSYYVYNIAQDMFEFISSIDMETFGQIDTTAELLYKEECQQNAIQLYNVYTHFYPSIKK